MEIDVSEYIPFAINLTIPDLKNAETKINVDNPTPSATACNGPTTKDNTIMRGATIHSAFSLILKYDLKNQVDSICIEESTNSEENAILGIY